MSASLPLPNDHESPKFRPGNLAWHVRDWQDITADDWIINQIIGVMLDFNQIPEQLVRPRQYRMSAKQKSILQLEIDKLIDKEVVSEIKSDDAAWVSNVFLRPKPGNKWRLIIDLTLLNEYIRKEHFKMDHLGVATEMMSKGSYMASLDLRDAYYSVNLHSDFRKYVTFTWGGKIFQFNTMPFGLSPAPRVFTKIMKPVFALLRREGIHCFNYIDDCFVIADTEEKCQDSVNRLEYLLKKLGFIIHEDKSQRVPTQEIIFLGYILNSQEMTVRPTPGKKEKLIEMINQLRGRKWFPIREIARIVGLIVDLTKAVNYGLAHYKQIEIDKIIGLTKAGPAQFDGSMHISEKGWDDLSWWVGNIQSGKKDIKPKTPDITLTTDASKEGWGAVVEDRRSGGRWSPDESTLHINVLEMKAVLLGLETFLRHEKDVTIKILSDNCTTVSYINKMGGTKSMKCNTLARELWRWAEERKVWLIASYIPGRLNVEADFESRHFSDDTEWSLNESIFQDICTEIGKPDVDLFASRHNYKVNTYVSWVPDPKASYVDAFSLNWATLNLCYLFPPFSLIGRCLQKIQMERATAILVTPNWPGQAWYSKLIMLCRGKYRIVQSQPDNLFPCFQSQKEDFRSLELVVSIFYKGK